MRLPSFSALSYRVVLRAIASIYVFAPLLAYLLTNRTGTIPASSLLCAAGFTGGLCILPGALKFPRWASFTWFFSLNLLAATVLYAVLVTGDFPNLATALSALKTDANEASQMLSATKYAVVLVVVSWLVQLAGCLSFAKVGPRFSFSNSRFRILAIAPLTLPMLAGSIAQVYPANLVGLLIQVAEYAGASEQVDLSDKFRVWSTRPAHTSKAPELVVFVLGESSQAEYWQLLGYPEPSSPAMVRRQAAGELLSFSRHMSVISMTRLAVPALMSPFDELVPRAKGRRPSLVSVMRRAGYDTAWLSVQGALPPATEAEVTGFTGDFEVLGFPGMYDDRLLGQAHKWLGAHETRPGFLVLHMAGSHVPYEGRYPASAAHWHDYDGTSFPKSQTVGNYLNTILYTDTILDQLMTQLTKEVRPVLLVYISDHGESSMRGESRDHAPVESMLHVPFIVWSNAQWRAENGTQWAALQKIVQNRTVTSHLNVVPTLTSVLGLNYDGKPAKRDLLSPSFEPWSRTPAIQPKTMKRLEVVPVP